MPVLLWGLADMLLGSMTFFIDAFLQSTQTVNKDFDWLDRPTASLYHSPGCLLLKSMLSTFSCKDVAEFVNYESRKTYKCHHSHKSSLHRVMSLSRQSWHCLHCMQKSFLEYYALWFLLSLTSSMHYNIMRCSQHNYHISAAKLTLW